MFTPFDAKLVAILIISSGTFLFGILPSLLGLGSKCNRSVSLSAVLCFGGGVLLATSLVHILPETRESLLQWAEVTYCAGFFALYLMDVILQLFSESHHAHHSSRNSSEEESLLGGHSRVIQYESTERAEPPITPITIKRQHYEENDSTANQWNVSNFGMLVAFSIHSLLEGLVVGVQTTPRGVLLLVGAVCCHKLVVAFCLGAELSAGGRPLYAIIPPISVYVVGSAMGIALGMIMEHDTLPQMITVVPVLQALAGGTLLYVVLSEILPRERARDLPRFSPAVQFLALVLGFTVMVLLNVYV